MAEVEAPTTTQKVAAEALGTFVLVLLGCGSAAILSLSGSFDTNFVLTVGLTFGLSVMLMIYAVGRISGGHFNPAVSVGAALGGRMSWKQVPIYVGAQLAGAILGGAVLLGLMLGIDGFDAFEDSLGANGWGDDGSGYALWAALLVELVLTAIFVFVILAVTDERNEHPAMAPLVIGLTLAAIHFVAIPLTGTSLNPARSIGPALFSGTDPLVQVWVFILAPLLGAAVGGLAYPAIFGHGVTGPVPGSGLNFGASAGAVPGYGAPDQFQQQWNQQPSSGFGAPAPGTFGAPAPGGYAAPASYQPAPDPAAQSYQSVAQPVQQPVEQPIIQDGWQWDPQAQQWIPAQQQPPAQQGGWGAPSGGESTQVRPPDGQ